MKMKIFSIKDSKANAFQQPFFERTEGTATRALAQTMKEKNNFSEYAEDYDLYQIGEFNDDTGKIEAMVPKHISSLAAILAQLEFPGMEVPQGGQGEGLREAGAS